MLETLPVQHRDSEISLLSDSDRLRLLNAERLGLADSTRRVYESQWRNWRDWAGYRGVSELPAHPDMVRAYMAERAEFGVSTKTLRVAASAIAHIHSLNGLPNPIDDSVRRTLKDLGQQYHRGQRQAAGLTEVAMAAVKVAVLQPRRKKYGHMESVEEARRRGMADIAMMSLMRDALLRVGEAADLRWEDLARERDGTGRLLIRRSKTDREGQGAVAFVSAPTMNALADVRNGAGPGDSVFGLSARQMRRRIKAAAECAGLGAGFSGHSARVGMAQDLVRAGTELTALMNAGRWKSHEMPAHYTRNEEAGRGAVARYYGAA